MKPSDLSEFFSLLGKAKKEKEEEFDNLLKEADINLDDLTSSLVSGIKEAKEDQKKQKKNEEKLIEQLDSIIDVIENPKEVKDITEPAVTVGVPEDFDVSKLEEEDALDVQDWNDGKDVKFTEVDAVDIIKPEPIKTTEINDTVAQAIKFIEETNIKEEIENSDETNLDKLKTEIKQVRDILYKVLAHGPGSGEVNLLKLDDVDTTDLGDEKVLSYDASTEKLKFVEQSGGSGVSTENVRTGILDVAGIATFRNNTLVGTGITLSPDGDIFVTGVTTATKFVGDGSGLTGITASGSGVVVQDEGSAIGTAATINFIGSNVNAALSGGIANVTVTPGITTANVRTGILDVAGIATFRNDTLIGSGVTLSPDGDIFATGVTTSSSFVGDLTGDVTGTASNATQLNSQAASYYLDYDNFSNTPTIPTNNNQLTNGAGYITGSALNASNLSSGTIPDARFPSTLPAIDGSALTGIAVTDNIRTNTNATFLQNVNVSGTTTATTFIGNLTGNVTGNVSGTSGSTTGNAATATALANARTIGGVSFDGSANIDLPGVNSSGNQDTTGNAATSTKLATARTIAGVSFDGSANISLNNNAITNGAGYITATLTDEEVQDKVGAMFTGNTETGITATYQDADGTIDLVVGTLNQDTTGNAATATTLETARNIGGVSFDGSANIDLPGVNSSGNQDTTGNAATATKLAATKTIAGVAFDGSANISLNNNAITNGAGYITTSFTNTNQLTNGAGFITASDDITGNAATATTLETARNIGGVSFNGSSNIDLPGVNSAGNQDTTGNAATATTLETARNIGGVSFDGSANIDLPGVNSAGNQNTTGTSAGLTGTPSITVNAVNGATGTFSGNVTIGGVLTYEDVTNVDSIGVITARSGVLVGSGITLSPDGDIFTTGISTFSDNVRIIDNKSLLIGDHASGDLSFVHDGNNSVIRNRTGDLYVSNASQTYFQLVGSTGAVKASHGGNLKFETTSSGITVTGTAVATSFTGDLTGDVTGSISGGTVAGSTGTFTTGVTTSLITNKINLGDNEKIHCGIGSDLEIYHSGNHSFIKEKGTGSLFISSNQFNAYNQAANEKMIVATQNSSVELYHDNTLRFTTSDSGAEITGDLETTSDVKVGSGVTLSPDGDGFFTGVTTSITSSVIGSNTSPLTIGAVSSHHLTVANDNASMILGKSNSDALYLRREYATGRYTFQTFNGGNDGSIALQPFGGKVGIASAIPTSTLDVNGDVRVGSGITLSPDGDIFAVGVSTFTDNVTLPDNVELKLGSAGEVRLYHTGSVTNFIVSQHYFNMQANGYQLFSQNGSESIMTAYQNGAVNLFFDNTKRFETTNTGITVTGTAVATSFTGDLTGDVTGDVTGSISGGTVAGSTGTFTTGVTTSLRSNKISVGDDEFINVGLGSDLQIYHNPNSSYIDNNTGHLFIRNNADDDDGGNIYIQAKSGEQGIIVNDDGAVQIYHDNSQKLVTSSTGITVTGTAVATSFTGDLTGDVTGNADTATTLATARNIGGVSFDGSANIDLPGVNSAGNQNTSGTAAGLSGTPNISCGTISGSTGSFSGNLSITNKIIHSGDVDTSIAFPDADTFTVDTGGSERLRIDSSGFIGAGTANPRRHFHLHNSASATVGFQMTNGNTGESNDSQGFQLKVGSDSHAEISQMENSYLAILTNATERVRITSGGRVIIGDTDTDNATTDADNLVIGAASGDNGMTIVSQSGNYNGTIRFSDGANSGADSYRGTIQYYHGGDYMRFYTNGAEKLRITSGGQVNIGDDYTQTTYKTQIEATDNNVLRLVNDSDDTNGVELVLYKDSASPADGDNIGGIYFQGNDDAGNSVFYANIEGLIDDASDGTEDGYIRFRTRKNGSIGERVRIQSNGEVTMTSSGSITAALANLHVQNDTFRVSNNDDGADTTYIHLHSHSNGTDADRHVYRQVTDSVVKAAIDQSGRVMGHSHHYAGRTRTDENSPSNVYTHANAGFFAYSARTDDASNYRTTFHMRAWDSGDVADRNAFYLVDSQDDTTTADYDQHQRFGIKANGMTQSREDIWSGRCESDEASPNSVYTTGNTNLVRSYATNSQAQSYMQGVAVPATNIYCFYAETGTSTDDDDIQFRVRSTDGRVQTDAGSVQTGGADYAEFFEWEDGNPSNEDRVGTSVVLVGEKIRPATSSDDPSQIIGIISATPCVVGDAAALKYHDRYLKDDWGRDILEEVEMLVWNIGQNEHQPKQTDTFALAKADECCRVSDIETYLAQGHVPQWAVDQNLRRIDKVRKVNPDFDVNKKDTYEPREDRKEWDAVGLVGKLCMKKGQPTGTNWIKLSDKTASIERWLVR